MSMSLGMKLKKTADKYQANKDREEMIRIEAERVRKEAEERRIHIYFNEQKQFIENTIVNGKHVKNIKIPSYICGYGNQIDKQDHEYYSLYENFINWGKENDLDISFIYAHDGMGMESWFELKVEPREGL